MVDPLLERSTVRCTLTLVLVLEHETLDAPQLLLLGNVAVENGSDLVQRVARITVRALELSLSHASIHLPRGTRLCVRCAKRASSERETRSTPSRLDLRALSLPSFTQCQAACFDTPKH